ncbi:MAG: DNA-3-methyladenine glycosylase 2 family protein [Trueperaceae bacterium]|nr:DNA-3-methyladenine glycosylase 2 family protein [Trueperaceae bacterium]
MSHKESVVTGCGGSEETDRMRHVPLPTPLTEASYTEAVERLAASDSILGGVVARWGAPPFWRHPAGFAGLVHGILAQQVSLESAVAAFGKLEATLGSVEPASFLLLDDSTLRAIGFSRPKAAYARGLAEAVSSGVFDLAALDVAADEEVHSALVQLRGIGRWTAGVYLLFALRRPDAWPSGDLALAKSVQELHGLEALPSWDELDAWAERWRPRRAVAARFLWHDYLSRRGRVSVA